jgi:sec-independent protein translocase protein TatC
MKRKSPPDLDRRDQEPAKKPMPLMAHLGELRKRLILSLIGLAAAVIACLVFAGPLYGLVAAVIAPFLKTSPLIYTSPSDPVFLYVKVALIAGVFVASPFIFLQLWLFIAPGLTKREKRIALCFAGFAALLFLGGGAFGYFLALPLSLRFLLSVAGPFQPMITITGYFDLALAIVLGCGLVFEIPVLIFFLTVLGLVTGKFLIRHFHYAVFIIAVIAAVITPTTDMVTMIVFMIPMIALYAVGTAVAFVFGKKDKGRDKT